MNNPALDAGIPVLTEIIPSPQPDTPERAAHEEPAPPAIATIAAPEDAGTLAVRAAAEWSDENWQRLEAEVRERVLQQILQRIDFVLEQRVRDSLADVLQTAVENLAAEIRGGLHSTIKDAVSRAVSTEIAKLQSSKK